MICIDDESFAIASTLNIIGAPICWKQTTKSPRRITSSITTCVDPVMKGPQLPTIESIGMQYEAQISGTREVTDLSLVCTVLTGNANAFYLECRWRI